MSDNSSLLEGVRVLDLSRLLPGPMCTAHLAAMGADVIKVEDPQVGDYARSMGSFFEAINRGKRSVAVDLKEPGGRDMFMALAKTADVVLEGFRPGVVASLGIGYDEVRAVNPGIVYCSLSGYGQTGPYRLKPGHDINYLAVAGVLNETAGADGAPGLCNVQIADLLGGAMSAAMGILAALFNARQTGRGRYLDVSMTDCSLAHNVMPLMAFNDHGASAPRGEDFLTGGLPWYNVYATLDGRHVALGALEPKFWRAFCDEIERPDWREQPADPDVRRRIRHELAEFFGSRPLEYWVERFADVDCCLSPVLTLEESMRDPQLEERGMFINRDGRTDYAFPIRFEPAVERPGDGSAPSLGQHTAEVLEEIGYTPDPRERG
ncbi:MAG TPA: CaiB/BaiF CoA-transferase family protein [Arenicellales bacterium]|nr:CaiB/BaiF CoA-transferase family protein [Arenicellales bacterium]